MPVIKRNFPNQTGMDGALSPEFQDRIRRLRGEARLTLADVAHEMKISGPFLSQLLKEDHPARVRTMHLPRFVSAIEALEGRHGIGPVPTVPTTSEGGIENGGSAEDLLETLIRHANSRGFSVTFAPLPNQL